MDPTKTNTSERPYSLGHAKGAMLKKEVLVSEMLDG